MCRGGEGRPVATVMPVGGGGGSEGEPEEGMSEREGKRTGAAAWRRAVHPERRGEDRQAGREEAWRGGARARRAHAVPLSGRKTTEEGGPGGLGRLLAGPACCGWAAQGGAPGKPLLLLFLFSIFFLTFVLI